MIAGHSSRIWCFVLWVVMAGTFLHAPGVGAQEQVTRKVKREVKPAYPPLATQMRISGAVKVTVVIAPNGKVTSARAVGGHPILINAAVDAANRFEFEDNSKETSQTLEFKFDFDGRGGK